MASNGKKTKAKRLSKFLKRLKSRRKKEQTKVRRAEKAGLLTF